MYNHNKAEQSKNHVHISWDILYKTVYSCVVIPLCLKLNAVTNTILFSIIIEI